MLNQAKTILEQTFGYRQFRPLQQEIIANVLKKNDTLVIMPTGGGKSLCYQIPALIFGGMTLVVSPLISLMKDQVEQLVALGVDAVFLNSSLSFEDYQRNVARIRRNKIKLLYLAPESLLSGKILTLLSSLKIDCITIDEAHCISEWGHDFRPEYRRLITVRGKFPEAVCIALTATATPRVQEDIKANLKLDNSNQFIASFNRENLFLQIVPKDNPLLQTIEFLAQRPKQSGIIYCFSRRQVDELTDALAEEGFSVKPYHAGMTDRERKRSQELFIKDDVQIIVATIAFGMGINKPNVRFVIHFDLPKNIESYYQQIGRAGRDGLPAHCLLLFSYGDIQKIKYFIDQKEEKEQRIAQMHLSALVSFAETIVCRRKPLLNYFGERYTIDNCRMCDNCLAGKKPLQNITIAAQKFLSCVVRTGELFGAHHIIDVLRGSQGQKVLKFQHQNLSTYGIGKEFSKRQWLHLSRQFIQNGFLEQDTKTGSLRISEKAKSVLQSGEKVFGHLVEEKADFRKTPKSEQEYDHSLFDLLRKKRKEMADSANLPPYVIFPDKALIEISVYYPQSEENFLQIYGVGRAKFSKYGGEFLTLIREYCEANRIAEVGRHQRKSLKNRTKTGQKPRHTVIGEMFNTGISIRKITANFNIKETTVLDNLYKFIQDGRSLNRADEFKSLSSLSPTQQTEVLLNFTKLGVEYLKPVFDEMDGQISYDELRILRLFYLSG